MSIPIPRTSTSYTVRSSTPCAINPSRCWMNIGVKKLAEAAQKKAKFRFICDMPDCSSIFSIKAKELQTALKGSVAIIGRDTSQEKFSFYLDYQEGMIYATVTQRDRTVLCRLTTDKSINQDDLRGEIIGKEKNIGETMGLTPIDYNSLSAKQKEIYNIQKLCSILADYGYESHKIVNDSNYADVIAYRNKVIAGNPYDVLLLQVKGRLTVKSAYQGKNLYIAFPDPEEEGWYIIPHDVIQKHILPPSFLETKSWQKQGIYHVGKLSQKIKHNIEPYLLPRVK